MCVCVRVTRVIQPWSELIVVQYRARGLGKDNYINLKKDLSRNKTTTVECAEREAGSFSVRNRELNLDQTLRVDIFLTSLLAALTLMTNQ